MNSYVGKRMIELNARMGEAGCGIRCEPHLFNNNLLTQQLFLDMREALRAWKQDG